jgi:hypothetical protein
MYGTGTLHLFGITCRTSSTEGTNYVPVEHSDSESDTDDYSSWTTTYYNLKGECGSSKSTGCNYSSGTYSKWETSYSDVNGNYLGRSITHGERFSSSSYDSWSTTYYDVNDNACGTSKTEGGSYSSGSYNSWKTSYYNNERDFGSSTSEGRNYSSGSYSGWSTTFSYCVIKITQPKVLIVKDNSNDEKIPNQSVKRQCPKKVVPVVVTKISSFDHKMNRLMREGKAFYISKTWCKCFNASNDIFGENRTGDAIISSLYYRAARNPGGASSKTLQEFGY